jgi:phosphoesterase RecJ-like protein
MMTDTGNFSYNSNDPDLYTIIAELLKKGINKDDIYKRVMDTAKANVLRMKGYAMYNMQLFPEAKAALITLNADELKQFDYERGDTEGLVNEPLAIEDVVYSVFLREDDRHIKVSTRSKGDFPVNKICEKYFNGGGHVNAAGGELYCTLEEAINIFKETLNDASQYLTNNHK